LNQLREHLDELPRDKEIQVICRSGQRAFTALRILLQHGFNARNVSGGMLSRTHAFLFSNETEPGDNGGGSMIKEAMIKNENVLIH
jgi:hypothetical protein